MRQPFSLLIKGKGFIYAKFKKSCVLFYSSWNNRVESKTHQLMLLLRKYNFAEKQ